MALRIKDNIDLKELEKFGFKKYKNGYCTEDTFVLVNPANSFEVNQGIYENSHESTETYADTLYDLIKADLVEKVDK